MVPMSVFEKPVLMRNVTLMASDTYSPNL